MKPGGRLLVTCYMLGEGEPIDEFSKYLKQRNYSFDPLNRFIEVSFERLSLPPPLR